MQVGGVFKGCVIRAQKLRSKRISCNGQCIGIQVYRYTGWMDYMCMYICSDPDPVVLPLKQEGEGRSIVGLAYTRYCHYEWCMVPGTHEEDRGGTIHAAMLFVGKIQGGGSKRCFVPIIELTRAQSRNIQTNIVYRPSL